MKSSKRAMEDAILEKLAPSVPENRQIVISHKTLAEIADKICTGYCKHPDAVNDKFGGDLMRGLAALESICAKCPLNRLL